MCWCVPNFKRLFFIFEVWNFLKGFCTHNFGGHAFPVKLLKFHPSIKRLELYSCCQRGEIRCWRLKEKKKKLAGTLNNHKLTITSVDFFGPQKEQMISSGLDQVICFFYYFDFSPKDLCNFMLKKFVKENI